MRENKTRRGCTRAIPFAHGARSELTPHGRARSPWLPSSAMGGSSGGPSSPNEPAKTAGPGFSGPREDDCGVPRPFRGPRGIRCAGFRGVRADSGHYEPQTGSLRPSLDAIEHWEGAKYGPPGENASGVRDLPASRGSGLPPRLRGPKGSYNQGEGEGEGQSPFPVSGLPRRGAWMPGGEGKSRNRPAARSGPPAQNRKREQSSESKGA